MSGCPIQCFGATMVFFEFESGFVACLVIPWFCIVPFCTRLLLFLGFWS